MIMLDDHENWFRFCQTDMPKLAQEWVTARLRQMRKNPTPLKKEDKPLFFAFFAVPVKQLDSEILLWRMNLKADDLNTLDLGNLNLKQWNLSFEKVKSGRVQRLYRQGVFECFGYIEIARKNNQKFVNLGAFALNIMHSCDLAAKIQSRHTANKDTGMFFVLALFQIQEDVEFWINQEDQMSVPPYSCDLVFPPVRWLPATKPEFCWASLLESMYESLGCRRTGYYIEQFITARKEEMNRRLRESKEP